MLFRHIGQIKGKAGLQPACATFQRVKRVENPLYNKNKKEEK